MDRGAQQLGAVEVLSALILGGAAGVWEEAAAARKLFRPDLLIATNHAGRDSPEPPDHWVSFHVELLEAWVTQRASAGLPPAGAYWSVLRRLQASTTLDVRRTANWGGSSGLLAVTVALDLGCTHIVVAGCPLEMMAGHYDDPKPWRDAGNYRRAWRARQTDMAAVRSMSGWTRELLGSPTRGWFHEGQENRRRSARLPAG